MQFLAAIIATSALLSSTSASPLFRRQTCGSTPAGSTDQTPLSQPTGITTASACQAQCDANESCQSFVFGMVDNNVQCILYSVAATSVPKQTSTNLVAYDKACSSVPAVVPTAANPTGSNTASSSSSSGTSTGSPGSGSSSNTGGTTPSNNTPQSHRRALTDNLARLAVRDTCGNAPAATLGSAAPIETQMNVQSAADCKSKCQTNPSCKSFIFGEQKCELYAVAAASVPKMEGQSVQVYDVGCSV